MSANGVPILQGDALALPLADESVHTVVTSPPYWGLRDYGVPGQLGLEETPDEYVTTMVDAFREIRRVLRPDGTVWLNIGDSYAARPSQGDCDDSLTINRSKRGRHIATRWGGGSRHAPGLKPKDLVGMPWRLAFALQADGWYLRSDIIWAKPNPMPESVRDRPTKSHEYVFLLARSRRYFYDSEAVRLPDVGADHARRHTEEIDRGQPGVAPHRGLRSVNGRNGKGAALRTVWPIATRPFPEAHFATFPMALVEPCVRAGTSEHGCCPGCGTPWRRVLEVPVGRGDWRAGRRDRDAQEGISRSSVRGGEREWLALDAPRTVGWEPSCSCGGGRPPTPAIVLDPFAGSGTTGVVARRLGRRFVGVELSHECALMARERVRREGRLRESRPMRLPDTMTQESLGLWEWTP